MEDESVSRSDFMASLTEFVRASREKDELMAKIKTDKKTITENKRNAISFLTEQLAALSEDGRPVYIVDTDTGKKYVALKKYTSRRSLTPEMVQRAMAGISVASVKSQRSRETLSPRCAKRSSEEQPKKRAKTSAHSRNTQEIADVFLKGIEQIQVVEKKIADILPSVPRDATNIITAPKNIAEAVTVFSDSLEDEKTLKQETDGDRKRLDEKEESCRTKVDEIMKSSQRDTFEIRVKSDDRQVQYFVRRKDYSKKKLLKIEDVKNIVLTEVERYPIDISSPDAARFEELKNRVQASLLKALKEIPVVTTKKLSLDRGRPSALALKVKKTAYTE